MPHPTHSDEAINGRAAAAYAKKTYENNMKVGKSARQYDSQRNNSGFGRSLDKGTMSKQVGKVQDQEQRDRTNSGEFDY